MFRAEGNVETKLLHHLSKNQSSWQAFTRGSFIVMDVADLYWNLRKKSSFFKKIILA